MGEMGRIGGRVQMEWGGAHFDSGQYSECSGAATASGVHIFGATSERERREGNDVGGYRAPADGQRQ